MYTRWLPMINSQKVILASGSPQRLNMLTDLGIKFEAKPSNFAENLVKTNPKEYVEKTCMRKFEEFLKDHSDMKIDILITADTIIEQDGSILEKPQNEEDIYTWFRNYSNHTVTCYTSVVIGIVQKELIFGKNLLTYSKQFTTESKVTFDEITDDMISDYIKTGEPYQRAGGFAIQGVGKCLIKRIEGCYFNVVGFPVNDFSRNLVGLLKERFGEEGWKI